MIRVLFVFIPVLLAVLFVPSHAAADERIADCVDLPGNIRVAQGYRAAIVELIARSPTLRRQCLTIARSSGVQVRLDSTRTLIGHGRARTSFARDRSGALHATIEIPISHDFTELLAHELEHVVEQIEGLNLRRMARVPDSGVRQVGRNVFETTRALHAGRAAARETRRPLALVAAKN